MTKPGAFPFTENVRGCPRYSKEYQRLSPSLVSSSFRLALNRQLTT